MRVLGILAATVLAAGCGLKTVPEGRHGSSGGAGSTGGAGTSGGTTGPSGSAGSTTGSASSTGGSSGTPGSYKGGVYFASTTLGGQTANTVFAGFVDASAPFPTDPADCTGGTQEGACCFRPANAGGSGGTSGASAGPIALSDNSSPLTTMNPGANGAYPPAFNQPWSAGDTLGANADGDFVRAFQGSVAAPGAVTIVSPVSTDPLRPAQVSTGVDLIVAWSGLPATLALVTLSTAGAGTLVCKGADMGFMTVPSSSLAHLAGAQLGLLTVARANDKTLPDSNAQVTLSASAAAQEPVQLTP